MGVLKPIKRVRKRGDIAFIFITHNEIHSQLVADHFTFLALGQVIDAGTKDDLESSRKIRSALLATAQGRQLPSLRGRRHAWGRPIALNSGGHGDDEGLRKADWRRKRPSELVVALRHGEQRARRLRERRQRAVRYGDDRGLDPASLADDRDDFVGVVAKRDGDQRIGRSHRPGHVCREPSGSVQADCPEAQHAQHVA